MTPTATKTKPSTELGKLKKQWDNAYSRLNAIKRERSAYETETEALRSEYTAFVNERPEDWRDEARNPKPASPSTEKLEALKKRMSSPNPRQADFDAAQREFLEVDAALQRFRRSQMFALVEEVDPEYRATVDRLRSALEEIIEAEGTYRAITEHVASLIRECPGLDGQALVSDPRPGEWRKMAELALEHDVMRPGISEVAAWKLNQQ